MASAKRGLFFNKVPVVKATADNIRAFGDESTDLTTLSATSQGVDLDIESAVGDRQANPTVKAPQAKPLAKVPEMPQVPEMPEEKAVPSKDLAGYSEELQDLAIDILGEEEGNPYKDKSSRPIFPIQTRLGFQKQILRVYSSFIKIPELGKEPDFDACKKLGATQALEVYEYQKFVREYVRQASPYRGLLVYHGLG